MKKDKKKSFSWKRIWIVVLLFAVILGGGATGLVAYAKTYQDRVLPGVHIGSTPLGGMTREELREHFFVMNNKMVDDGIQLRFVDEHEQDQSFTISPVIVSEDVGALDVVSINVEQEVEAIMRYQKHSNVLIGAWSTLATRFSQPHIQLEAVSLDKDLLFEELAKTVGDYETYAQNAGVDITSVDPMEYTVTTSSVGVQFDYEDIAGRVTASWSRLESPNLEIKTERTEPTVLKEEVERAAEERLSEVFSQKNITLHYTDPGTTRSYNWAINQERMVDWVEPQKQEDGTVIFGLSASSTKGFLDSHVADTINVDAEDARFEIGEDGKVTEFKGSRPGIGLDVEATYNLIQNAMMERNGIQPAYKSSEDEDAETEEGEEEGEESADNDAGTEEEVVDDEIPAITTDIDVVVSEVDANVKTEEVNDLGIKEILGVGHSKYLGSSAARMENIRHGVEDKLHGRLIKPDEEFSLVNTLKPFTFADGYTTEKVIKGNRIEEEIGGGLCQVGTTIFRATMNAGLPVTQRTNHGLVVSYYNDLTNGLPGTDATIYDPAPDYRFVNDTGNYILITVDMDIPNRDLFITFWGTSDGREGSYTHPTVSNWYYPGPEQRIESTEYPPGYVKCQPAYTGADASFTYTRVLPNGEKIDRVFNSRYRAVPRICIVGATEVTTCQEGVGGTGCGDGDTGEGTGETPAEPPEKPETPPVKFIPAPTAPAPAPADPMMEE